MLFSLSLLKHIDLWVSTYASLEFKAPLLKSLREYFNKFFYQELTKACHH